MMARGINDRFYTRNFNFLEFGVTAIIAFKPLTKDDIAEVLGVSLRTVENWVNEGTLPAPRKLGNRVYWHPNTFYGWLDRYLTGPVQDCSLQTGPDSRQHVVSKNERVKPAPSSKTKEGKSERDRLRAREQAKLDALLA